MSSGSVILGSLYWIAFPIIYLIQVIIAILYIILAPLFYLGSYTVSAFLYPFRLVPKFETLYIFIGVAVIVGILTGTTLHFTSSTLISIFNLNQTSARKRLRVWPLRRMHSDLESEKGVTSQMPLEKSSLAEGNVGAGNGMTEWDWTKQEPEQGGNGVIPSTILEEDDSSEMGP